MIILPASSSNKKAQMKIQQMAFVLVAVFIFFAMVAVFYLSIRTASLRGEVSELREESAKEAVVKLASTSEFAWKVGRSKREDCPNCVDFDKAFALREIEGYGELWGFDYIALEKVYPESEKRECTRSNYPDCNKITIIGSEEDIGTPKNAYVAVCRWVTTDVSGYRKCELGRLLVTGDLD